MRAQEISKFLSGYFAMDLFAHTALWRGGYIPLDGFAVVVNEQFFWGSFLVSFLFFLAFTCFGFFKKKTI